MKIWLDDQLDDPETTRRHTPDGYVGAKKFEEFKLLIEGANSKNESAETISFDNDLGEEEIEGHEILSWLADNYPQLVVRETKIEIHSANPVEREAMKKQLDSYLRNKELLLGAKDREHPWGEIEKLK